MTAEFALLLFVALVILAVWGYYCYIYGRGRGQQDLVENMAEAGVIVIDDDGVIHSGRAYPLPSKKRAKKAKPASSKKAPRRQWPPDDMDPPSAPAV